MGNSFYMNVDVGSADIARNMVNDTEFGYNVLSDLADSLNCDYEWFADELFKHIFEEENTELLLMLNAIVEQFEHLKETPDEEV